MSPSGNEGIHEGDDTDHCLVGQILYGRPPDWQYSLTDAFGMAINAVEI